MNPFEKIKRKIDAKIHDKLPKKWKKIGNIVILNLEGISENKKSK